MRRIFAFGMTTLDGYYEGPNQEFDFWTVDDEFKAFSADQLEEVDTLLFGRITYEGMAAYWPTPAAEEDDPTVAARMNSLAKVVVSRTLAKAAWTNTRLLSSVEDVGLLKREPGGNIAILGSLDLTTALIGIGLVDELRVMVNPVILGAGKSVFRSASERIGVRLLESRPFNSGNVLLCYQPIPNR